MDLLGRYLDTGYSYPDVGMTAAEVLDGRQIAPGAYHRLHRRTALRAGRKLADAAELLLTWQMHRRVGLRPVASAPRAAAGVTVVSRLGPLPVPCRVVWAVTDERRAGFAYGTLDGHPECGEEAFLLERMDDGRVWFTVCAFTRPGRWYTRLAGPLAPLAQDLFARAYSAALDSG
jgi:uncharacterized protein (UPF0548 family)